MKTMSQLSKDYNISPQAVYKRLKRLSNKLSPYLDKDENGRTVVNIDGERILMSGIEKINIQDSQAQDNQNNHVDNQFNVFLQDQIKVKDQQIKNLLEQNKDLVKKVENMQVLLRNEQEIKTLTPPPTLMDDHQEDQRTKKGIFHRLLRRK